MRILPTQKDVCPGSIGKSRDSCVDKQNQNMIFFDNICNAETFCLPGADARLRCNTDDDMQCIDD